MFLVKRLVRRVFTKICSKWIFTEYCFNTVIFILQTSNINELLWYNKKNTYQTLGKWGSQIKEYLMTISVFVWKNCIKQATAVTRLQYQSAEENLTGKMSGRSKFTNSFHDNVKLEKKTQTNTNINLQSSNKRKKNLKSFWSIS